MTEKSLTENFDINYSEIKENIKKAAELTGRNEKDIILLAATKTVSPELINYAIENGIEYIGENRVQEFLAKDCLVNRSAHRHFIGHLQTNKVRDIIDKVEMIESVSSLKLAKTISEAAIKKGIVMPVLIEINIGEEESKSGFFKDGIFTVLKELSTYSGIKVCGLMSIPPITNGDDFFLKKMNKLFIDIKNKKTDNIDMKYLSMGMSDDYYAAILNGANIVRIGTALFGKRNYK